MAIDHTRCDTNQVWRAYNGTKHSLSRIEVRWRVLDRRVGKCNAKTDATAYNSGIHQQPIALTGGTGGSHCIGTQANRDDQPQRAYSASGVAPYNCTKHTHKFLHVVIC